jgi:flagellar biosynthesis/type III secretory pathway protein FliH
MILTEWNTEDAIAFAPEEGWEEGLEKGREQGLEEGR